MRQMQARYRISFLFSSHDPGLIGSADDLIFLRDGQIRQIRRRTLPGEAPPPPSHLSPA